ncbi:1-acyl-sn-glycerol-3-phosphate acyltransferase [Helicobacter sp. 12S02232-10]|uniref:lysophospholipid acyltransferase family protein n=1 Tax=Helicobacter sp. 12S02232-10 TaxID=1476197 RepID=UPI000BCF8EA3|nr:1-acylglycerol-3-phosphate O-acyltransferase [Helicobacter sp. 12S02232-10]PAF49951.1 1-acyl-sn-glycerol-3-phosphate acyltransferase [Helicobacter sp. 12S02232-10]
MISSKLRAIYATLVIAIGLALIVCFIFFTKKKNNARHYRKWCRFFFSLTGLKLEKIGEFDQSASLVVMNHQSLSDIICLEGFHPSNICWVAKKELGEIPFYGYALRGPEMILIDREDKKGLALLLKQAKEKIEQSRPLVIFPEGTRSRGKEDFLPFKPGAKLLAEKLNLKIQPIVLINTRKIYNTKPLESPNTIARMVLLEAFEPEIGTDWYEHLESQMHKIYLKHYKELNA